MIHPVTLNGSADPSLSLSPAERARIRHLDKIAAFLEAKILAGRGDTGSMRREWRACQNEMRELEKGTDK